MERPQKRKLLNWTLYITSSQRGRSTSSPMGSCNACSLAFVLTAAPLLGGYKSVAIASFLFCNASSHSGRPAYTSPVSRNKHPTMECCIVKYTVCYRLQVCQHVSKKPHTHSTTNDSLCTSEPTTHGPRRPRLLTTMSSTSSRQHVRVTSCRVRFP